MSNSKIILGASALLLATAAYQAAIGDSAPGAAPPQQPNVNWTMWGGSPSRNNTPVGHDIPTTWDVGKVDFQTGAWSREGSKNIKWAAKLGSQTYGNATINEGKVFVGTNNTGAWLPRYPTDVDLGCLIAFDIRDGKFLWQHSSEKLPTGASTTGLCKAFAMPLTAKGIGCGSSPAGVKFGVWTPRVFTTARMTASSRTRTRPLARAQIKAASDARAAAGKPAVQVPYDPQHEADVVWVYDMMKEMGISQHNMCSCSIVCVGDTLFVCTSNGVDIEHNYIPAPDAPSFFAMDKNTGKVLWTDDSPKANIHHGQWSSPGYGEFDGQAQVLFGGGDGWLYSFDPKGDGKGKSKLLWKFDTNNKKAKLELMGRGTRNDIIAIPVCYDGKVYVATGQDPEHGTGVGALWCIDPTKRGDVSPTLAFNAADPSKPIPYKRVQAVVDAEGDFERPNPNSAVIWKYDEQDRDDDGEIAYEETMHRSCGTVGIKDDVLYVSDFSGLVHCLNAQTGKVNWVYDMFSASWGSPLIVEGKVYLGDEDGEVSIFKHSADPNEAMKEEDGEMVPRHGTLSMNASIYTTPVVAGNVLYIATQSHLFAISPEGK